MGTYRQYCPVARASEILAERWTPLLVRNLMFGADTFSEIARGVPAMSRSMLVTRLNQLERAGVVSRCPKPGGHGHRYQLTAAGRDLADVIAALAAWGERWIEVTAERSDPGFALWAWHRVQVDRSHLPERSVVVAFLFPDESTTNRRYWLRVERDDVELCYSDPGAEPDLWVTAASLPFVDWHRGARSWTDLVRAGDVRVEGPRALARALPTWHLNEPAIA